MLIQPWHNYAIPGSLSACPDGAVTWTVMRNSACAWVRSACLGMPDGRFFEPSLPLSDVFMLRICGGVPFALHAGRLYAGRDDAMYPTQTMDGWEITALCPQREDRVFLVLQSSPPASAGPRVTETMPYRKDTDHGFRVPHTYRLVDRNLSWENGFAQPPQCTDHIVLESPQAIRSLTLAGDCLVYAQDAWKALDLGDGRVRTLEEDFIPGPFAPAVRPDGTCLIAPGYEPGCPDVTLHMLQLDQTLPNPQKVGNLPDVVGRGGVYAELMPDEPSLMAYAHHRFLFAGAQAGRLMLFAIPDTEDAPRAEPFCDLPGAILEVASSEDHLYILHSSSTQPPRICLLEPSGAVKPMTHPMPAVCVSAHALDTPSQDGKTLVHAQLLLPPGDGVVPLLVWVHGGPEGFYTDAYCLEQQYAVSQGYAVLLPNPRGSTGWGPGYQHTDEAFSQGAPNDVLTLLDEALRTCSRLDRKRVAIVGGSYGGYMAALLAGRTDRFACAVAMKPVTNWLSIHFRSSQSGQTVFAEHFHLLDFLSEVFRTSPCADADHVTCPILLIHGAEDQQVPVENTLQFAALIRAYHPEVPCDVLIVPGACHRWHWDAPDSYELVMTRTLQFLKLHLPI